MVSERNRVIELKKHFETLGIRVNIAKNKAQGNKGFFKAMNKFYRIDVAKGLDEKSTLRTMIHEFAHFIHYVNDRKLLSLDFIFEKVEDSLLEEMLSLTVESIPKSQIAPLFEKKEELKLEIKTLTELLESSLENFTKSNPCKSLELKIQKTPYKYLLKYDRVKVVEGFTTNVYTIDSLKPDSDITNYLILKSKQRNLRRINSKISKMNRYYNSTTELFARVIESYVFDRDLMQKKAPKLLKKIDMIVDDNKIPELTKAFDICLKNS